MLTRCPYSDCFEEFALPDTEARSQEDRPTCACCPSCARPASFWPLDILLKIDRIRTARLADESKRTRCDEEVVALSVLLEDVRSLFNVGSIFRTADGAGFSRLYLCGITGCPPHKKIEKTSLGAEKSVDWRYAGGVLDAVRELKKQRVMIVGLERTADSIDLMSALKSQKLQTPLCLFVGNEVNGLSQEAIASCDIVCHLPMRGMKESLNVSVAFGIAAYLLADAFTN